LLVLIYKHIIIAIKHVLKVTRKMNEDGLRFFRPTLNNLDEIAALEAAGE
jgi:hypothetical protein